MFTGLKRNLGLRTLICQRNTVAGIFSQIFPFVLSYVQ